MSDQEQDPSTKLPARLTAYSRANDIMMSHAKKFAEAYKQRYGESPTRSLGNVALLDYYIRTSEGIKDRKTGIGIPSVGADDMIIDMAFYSILSDLRGPDGASADRHRLFMLNVHLFNDKSPYVIKGDKVEQGMQWDANDYYIILGKEMPPTLAQAEQLDGKGADGMTPQNLAEARKHLLTDADCEAVIEAFSKQTASVYERDASLNFTDFNLDY